jgi:hypothetical protein
VDPTDDRPPRRSRASRGSARPSSGRLFISKRIEGRLPGLMSRPIRGRGASRGPLLF